MKKLLIGIFLCSFVINGFSQGLCKKGTWIVRSNLFNYYFLNTQKRISTQYLRDSIVSKGGDTSKSNGYSSNLNFGTGYFVTNNFCIGFGIAFGGNIRISQIFRYYFRQQKSCFSFNDGSRWASFIDMNLYGSYSVDNNKDNYDNYVNGTLTSKQKTTRYGIGLGGGITYLLTRHIAIEMGLTYAYIRSHIENRINYPSGIIIFSDKTIYKDQFNGFNALIGMQVYF